MIGAASIAQIVYGLLLIAGGIVGYVKADSIASLVAGVGSGLAVLASFFVARKRPAAGFSIASLLCIALAAFFIKRYHETEKFMPNGMMLIVTGLCFLIFAAAGMVAKRKA